VRPTGFQPIHPRKLYAKLLACASVDERAKVTLDFLCGCTGAARGHLFLVNEQGLREAANSGQGAATQDLLLEAERALSKELDIEPDANRTRTIDTPAPTRPETPLKDQLWTSSKGSAYIRHVLGTYQDSHWTLVGIAMLEAGPKLAPLRHAYVEVVCNAFIVAGDVPSQPVDSPLRT
jgi:GAF domain-containing protein